MKSSAFIWGAVLALLLPAFAAAQQQEPRGQEAVDLHHVTTMPKMRSMVPTLVALGWDDFFLSRSNEIALSPAQGQRLWLLALAFLASAEDLNQRIQEAEVELYEKLDRDQVSLREIEDQGRWVGTLRAELVVLRLQYLIRAVNILTHEQHMALMRSLKLPAPQQPPPVSKSASQQLVFSPPAPGSAVANSPYSEVLAQLRGTGHCDACGDLSATLFSQVSKRGLGNSSQKDNGVRPR